MDQFSFASQARRHALPFPNCAILAAHPDDEVLCATSLLLRGRGPRVLHLTDGAPTNDAYWSPDVRGTAQDYARLRREESLAALAIAEIRGDRLVSLGGTDLEALDSARPLAEALVRAMLALRPEVLVTHSYEGGHPDHDAAALIARVAMALLRRQGLEPPTLWEMAGYHASGDGLVFGEFLPRRGTAAELGLSGVERAHKRAMLACHASQRRVLDQFPVDREAIRPAPRSDFSRPPHPGPLYYERLGFPIDGAGWRNRARRALEEMGLDPCL